MTEAAGKAPKEKKKASPIRGLAMGTTALAVLTTTAAEVPVQISKGFKTDVNGLIMVGSPSFEEATVAGNVLRVVEKSAQFALGDFANYIEEKFGEAAAQIIDAESGWSLKTVEVYKWLAKNVPKDRRRMDRLTIRHHMLVAVLTADRQRHWLKKAAADNEAEPWTVKRLKDALAEGEDELPTAWWVLVEAKSEEDQRKFMETLEVQGRSSKAVTRRGKKKKD